MALLTHLTCQRNECNSKASCACACPHCRAAVQMALEDLDKRLSATEKGSADLQKKMQEDMANALRNVQQP